MTTVSPLKFDPQHVAKSYWRYALPTLAAMMVSGLYQVVDGIFIGHVVGVEGLAAINMAWPWAGLMAGIGLMIGSGTGSLCSIAQGEQNRTAAGVILAHGMWLLVLVGMLTGLLVVNSSSALLAAQGASPVIQAYGGAYLDVMGRAAPLVLASTALPILVRNLGAPRLATVMMVAGALTNIGLDYLFIVRYGWGLRGAAMATVTGETLSVAIGLVFLFTRYSAVRLSLRLQLPALPQWRVSLRIIGTGFSSLLMYLYAGFAVVLHNSALMRYGTTMNVAAYAVTGYLMTVYYLLAEGLAGGMQPLVSYFHGAGLTAPIRAVFLIALKWIVGGGIAVVAGLMLFPHPVSWIFIDSADPVLQAAAVQAIRVHLFVLFLDGFLVLSAAYFQSVGQGRKATAITLANMCIQVPFLLGLAPLFGVTGILLALPLSTIVLAAGVAWIMQREFSRQ